MKSFSSLRLHSFCLTALLLFDTLRYDTHWAGYKGTWWCPGFASLLLHCQYFYDNFFTSVSMYSFGGYTSNASEFVYCIEKDIEVHSAVYAQFKFTGNLKTNVEHHPAVLQTQTPKKIRQRISLSPIRASISLENQGPSV